MPNIKETEDEVRAFKEQGFSGITVALSLNGSLVFVEDFDHLDKVLKSLFNAGAFAVAIFGWLDNNVRIRAIQGYGEEGLSILLEHKKQLLKI